MERKPGRWSLGLCGSAFLVTAILMLAPGRALASDALSSDDGDGLMCTDAMENVPPEHWPTVVAGFHRALRADSHAYVTVEEIDHDEIEQAFADGVGRGWPLVLGEVIEGDTAGYHFYPSRAQVEAWLHIEGFEIVEEADEALDGYGYHHLLLRASGPS